MSILNNKQRRFFLTNKLIIIRSNFARILLYTINLQLLMLTKKRLIYIVTLYKKTIRFNG